MLGAIAQPSSHGETIQKCSLWAGKSQDNAAVLCRLDQPSQFLNRQCASLVSGIFLAIESGDTAQHVFSKTLRVIAPFYECPDRGPVMVASCERTASGLQVRDGRLDRLGSEIAQVGLFDV